MSSHEIFVPFILDPSTPLRGRKVNRMLSRYPEILVEKAGARRKEERWYAGNVKGGGAFMLTGCWSSMTVSFGKPLSIFRVPVLYAPDHF